MSERTLLLDYGSGGKASHRLVKEIFFAHLGNDILNAMNDAALINVHEPMSMSTDSYTVDPIFFPGGDIGSLAVHGTVNDVSMMGAEPLFMTCGFILEEGLSMDDLERIVASMGEAVKRANVLIVAGDTKVVPKGAVDKVFINTTGIGRLLLPTPPTGARARAGDVVLISGTMGDHGLTILGAREGLDFSADVKSDSAALNHMVKRLVQKVPSVHVLRDPTRGGLATTLNEIAQQSACGIVVREKDIPVRDEVRSGCSILGLDPLYLANEGKLICILPKKDAAAALKVLREDALGADAALIGEVTEEHAGRVVLKTPLGGKRLMDMLEGEQLPRIC